MTNPGDSDEWWKQYGGEGVSAESGTPSSVPQYPTAQPSGYPSAPQYPQQPVPQQPVPQQAVPQMTPPQYPNYQPQQPAQPQPYPQPPNPAYPNAGYPNPAYPNAYQPYGYPQPQGTSGMAIGALVSSLAGFVTCGVGAIVGIILGVVALNQIKQSGQDGRGMALAGIWIGVGLVVLSVLWLILVIASSA
ncbi:DUF4190 domain-containing protein [Nocardia australiensis]|uniref:DUF4190 domain-containing protein n=1 Tax=Nocardia australiensis TaxID=2887191 RepID=UPI001D1373FA|nr:DUF4190 domain-containing protein [Nocardia australiensis]